MNYLEQILDSAMFSDEFKKGLREEIAGLSKKNGVPAVIRSGNVKATTEDARAILGNDFISSEEAMRVYGIKENKMPAIPFSIKTLEAGKMLGMHLVPQVSEISLKNIASLLKGKKCHDGNNLLWKDQFDLEKGELKKGAWFLEDQKVLAENILSVRWRLAMKKELAGTANIKFIPQLRLQANFLNDTFYANREMPSIAQKAIAEFNEREETLVSLQENDWQQCTKESMKLLLVRNFMENVAETLNRLVLEEQVHERKLLTGMYIRNNTSSSGGHVLDSGSFDSGGSDVGGRRPSGWHGNLGLSPSCTE